MIALFIICFVDLAKFEVESSSCYNPSAYIRIWDLCKEVLDRAPLWYVMLIRTKKHHTNTKIQTAYCFVSIPFIKDQSASSQPNSLLLIWMHVGHLKKMSLVMLVLSLNLTFWAKKMFSSALSESDIRFVNTLKEFRNALYHFPSTPSWDVLMRFHDALWDTLQAKCQYFVLSSNEPQ